MIYREAGQFKTNYGADQAMSSRSARTAGSSPIVLLAYVAFPLLANEFWLQGDADPLPGLFAGAIGLNS